MTNQKRRRFWVDPPLQLQMLATMMVLVVGSVFLVAYSVMHGLDEAAMDSQQIFHSLDWVRDNVRGPLMFSSAIAVLASAMIALIWSHRFAGPMRVLSASLARISEGNLSVPVRIRKSDMHQDLIQDLARMQEKMRGRLEEDIRNMKSAAALIERNLANIPDKEGDRCSAEALISELRASGSRYQL